MICYDTPAVGSSDFEPQGDQFIKSVLRCCLVGKRSTEMERTTPATDEI